MSSIPHDDHSPVRLYVEVSRLDDLLVPAHVTRVLGMTLLALDDRATKLAVAETSRTTCRPTSRPPCAGYGFPPYGQPLPDHWLEGTVDPIVPDSLALPWLRSDAPVTDDHPVSCDEIFVSVEWLPPHCCPAPVVRHLGLTSLTVEVLADRYELLRYMRDNLTDEEQGELFGRFGWPEGTVPLRWLDEVGPIPVPEALWWPHEGRWSAS